ncbi:beta-mannosidase [Sphaerotilus sp.]|uniref:beta-mannosidase n=1 Tax=Sphaerotilus sp. TaxID=2093942 RepID=UPI0025DA8A21|nr:glycoside hydrolase family 2 protein [Sphaerotilus sp.]
MTRRPAHTRLLQDGWQFREADPRQGDATTFSAPDGWRVATVPGSVHGDLLAQGAIPDPFLGRQEAEVQWVGERDWCYRLDFDVAADERRERVVLCFDGLDTFAKLWLDGEPLAESDNMFVPLRMDVTGRLGPGRHTLWMRFDSALHRGRAIEAHHGTHPLWNGDSSRLHVRKAPYHYGWDWGPTLLTCGPWKAVRLEASDLRIAELASPVTLSADLGHARVDVFTTLEGAIDGGTGTEVCHTLRDAAGTLVATHRSRATAAHEATLSVPTPQLWWPAGHGAQPLYTLDSRVVAADGTVLDTQQRRLGLRRLRLVQDAVAGEAGRSFVFEVNGRALFCGGANWIPDDNLLHRITPARYRERVQQAVDANLVMLRVWGGGIYEDEAFYDACDALGVLVWQDFLFACGLYPAYPAFVASVEAEARAAITRLRHRASLAIWCGNNEDYTLAETVGALGATPSSDPTRFEARVLYEQVLPTLCHALDPGRPYWPGSPYTPPAAGTGQPRLSQDMTTGDRHSWEVWHQLMLPYQRYAEVGARFVSEFGMQSHPSLAVLEQAIPAEERFPGSRTVQWHNKASSPVGMDGHRRLAVYRADTLRHPDTLAAEVYATQFVQAEAMRHAYEAFRRRWQTPGARACGGALVWQLNDCWPVTSWAIIDSNGHPKPAWYTIRRAMAPLACAVRRDDAGVSAWAVNGTDTVLTAQARWQLLAIDGEPIDDTATADVVLAANAVTPLTPPPAWFADRTRPLIGRLTLTDSTQTAHAHAWPEPFRWHRFPDPQVRVMAEPDSGCVLVSAIRPAKGVWLDAPGARFEDNFLDLLPGEVRRLRVHGAASGSVHGTIAGCLNTWQDAP